MAHEWAKGLLVTVLLVGLVAAVLPIEEWQRDTPGQESMRGIAQGLFGDTRDGRPHWLFAFEFLSILLLAALFGALYLSMKPPKGEEDEP